MSIILGIISVEYGNVKVVVCDWKACIYGHELIKKNAFEFDIYVE